MSDCFEPDFEFDPEPKREKFIPICPEICYNTKCKNRRYYDLYDIRLNVSGCKDGYMYENIYAGRREQAQGGISIFCSLLADNCDNSYGHGGCEVPNDCPKKNIMIVSSKFTIHIEKDPQFWRLDEAVCNECIKESLK